jgi:hypothetical protein
MAPLLKQPQQSSFICTKIYKILQLSVPIWGKNVLKASCYEKIKLVISNKCLLQTLFRTVPAEGGDIFY